MKFPTVATAATQTIMIARLGSIGDTVNSLPCFHQIVRSFPHARRILLTNFPVSSLAAPAETILRDGGFIHGAMNYAIGERRPAKLWELRRSLKAFNSNTLIYLNEARSLPASWRDLLFFRLCGFSRIIGLPLRADLARPRFDPTSGEFEREIERLTRCLSALGPIDLLDPVNWDLNLTHREKADAETALTPLGGRRFIAINTGGKVKVKDWGEDNWRAVLDRVSAALPDYGLVIVGAGEDSERAQRLTRCWRGPWLDLCGKLTPRQSAAVLARGLLFIGHDSGPLHLSAAVGLPCIAMFGDFNRPKTWHPIGDRHRIIHNMAGVMAITPDEVFAAVQEVLARESVETVAP